MMPCDNDFPSSLSNEDLARHIKGNDRARANQCMSELYRREMQLMVKVALYIVKDCDLAEDLAHECFMEKVVVRRLNQYSEGNVGSWLRVCVRHQCYTDFRRRANRTVHQDVDDERYRDATNAVEIEDVAINQLTFNCAWEKFRKTATEYELAVMDEFLDKRKVSLVADAMGLPPKTVTNMLCKARKRFLSLLIECGQDQ